MNELIVALERGRERAMMLFSDSESSGSYTRRGMTGEAPHCECGVLAGGQYRSVPGQHRSFPWTVKTRCVPGRKIHSARLRFIFG